MKTLKFFAAILLMVSLVSVISPGAFAQNPVCVDCGVSLPNGVHKRGCRYFVEPKTSSGSSGSSSQSVSKNLTETLIQGAVNAILNMDTGPSQKELEEQKRAEELKAMEAAEAKRIKEDAERAEHEKLMNAYKPLGKTEVKYKTLDETGKLTTVHYTCKLTSFTGDVQVKKANGTLIKLGEGANFDLAVGDVITTGSDGVIKIHYAFEMGGEDVTLGRNTKIKIMETPEGLQHPKVFNGQLRVNNPTMKEAIEQAYNDLKENLKNKLQHKFRVTTGSCAVAVRGTDFILSEQPVAGTDVHVLEGSVEIKGYGSDQSVVVEAGFSCNVTPEGAISGPFKTDLFNLDKWWEEAMPE